MSPRPRSGVYLSPPPATATAGNGGTAAPVRGRGGRPAGISFLTAIGPVRYLWLLVALEVAAIAGLRHYFRDHHGG